MNVGLHIALAQQRQSQPVKGNVELNKQSEKATKKSQDQPCNLPRSRDKEPNTPIANLSFVGNDIVPLVLN